MKKLKRIKISIEIKVADTVKLCDPQTQLDSGTFSRIARRHKMP